MDSIEIENNSSSLDSESSESTQAPETSEAPETTEAPESTDAPSSEAPQVVLNMDEVHHFIKHLMITVQQMMDTLVGY